MVFYGLKKSETQSFDPKIDTFFFKIQNNVLAHKHSFTCSKTAQNFSKLFWQKVKELKNFVSHFIRVFLWFIMKEKMNFLQPDSSFFLKSTLNTQIFILRSDFSHTKSTGTIQENPPCNRFAFIPYQFN